MRYRLIVTLTLLCAATAAPAEVSVGIRLPGVSIGINVPTYPELVPVPGYPVYYAPRVESNYFFYDGLYWVYHGDNWYASSWYNGPWGLVAPQVVPVYVLRVPVRYYRRPPVYFREWRPDAPPRWGEHWGHGWEQRRSGWDHWNHNAVPRPAPLPVYQRQYSGDRYPHAEQQQRELRDRNYRYQPRDDVVRRHEQEQGAQRGPVPSRSAQQGAPQERNYRQRDMQRPNAMPVPQGNAPQRQRDEIQRPVPAQDQAQHRLPAGQEQRPQPPQGAVQREQQPPRPNQRDAAQGRAPAKEPRRGQDQEKDRERGDERAQERIK